MKIRPATSADTSTIAKLHANSWRFAYRGVINDEYLRTEADRDRLRFWQERLELPAPNQRVLLLEENASLLGFACVYIDHDPEFGSFLNNLHVAQDHLGRGCGARLMFAVRDCCVKFSPMSPMYLSVVDSNVRARKFYLRFGGTLSGTTEWEPPGGGLVLLHRLAWSSLEDIRISG